MFAKEGAKVVVNCRKEKEKGQAAVDEINSRGGEAILAQADVSTPRDVKYLLQRTVQQFGTLDILINNAGIAGPKPFLDLTSEDWEEDFRTNVIGVFLCAQEAAKIMLKKKRGKIINVASVRGLPHCGRVGIMPYCASKSAVINFTSTLAKQLAPYINVNAVAPGFVETDMARGWDESTRLSALEDSYIKRLIQPEEAAQAILYLASEEADALTGQIMVIDGGYNLKQR